MERSSGGIVGRRGAGREETDGWGGSGDRW
jgi:hypothetical protein